MKRLIADLSDPAVPRLAVAEAPDPVPGRGELLVRVMASGLNRADLALTPDHYLPGTTVGSELTGEVVEVGQGVAGFAVGDRVMALSRGSHAEQACVDHRLAVRVPDSLDWQTAAALPAWYMTAHDALMTQGAFQPGEAVLVQGVTSGVGQAAARLARLNGARIVIGVARSKDKLSRLTRDEVDLTLTMDDDWTAAARDATAGDGVDLVVDMVGGGALRGNLESLAIRGRIVAVGRLGGASDTLDIGMLAFKRARLIGTTFRSRSMDEKAAIARAFGASVLPLVEQGRLQPRIDRVFPLLRAHEAQELMRLNQHFGKVLLAIQ